MRERERERERERSERKEEIEYIRRERREGKKKVWCKNGLEGDENGWEKEWNWSAIEKARKKGEWKDRLVRERDGWKRGGDRMD